VRVTLPAAALAPFRRFSLYNSPFVAHERGRAVDLYPDARREAVAPSPVAGTVRARRTVRAPPRPYAAAHDHLLLVEVDAAASGLGGPPERDLVARVLHVDPAVAPGDRVAVGDPLGRTVRSGFFAPWVADHLHLDLRPADRHLRRASGSVPLAVGVDPAPLDWDGRGRVVRTGETYAVLDAPAGGEPDRWVALAGAPDVALDGGLPHYEGGGALTAGSAGDRTVSVAGTDAGRVDADGRTVRWHDLVVEADGHPLTGLSLGVGRADRFGVKLVSWDGHPFAVGDRVRVRLRLRPTAGNGIDDRSPAGDGPPSYE
jgi:hypothetical protein